MKLELIQELEEKFGSMKNVPEDEPKLIELRKSIAKRGYFAETFETNEAELKARKVEILKLNAEGYGSAEIGMRVDISTSRVRDIIFKSGHKPVRKFLYIFKAEGKPDLYFMYRIEFDNYISSKFLRENVHEFERIKKKIYRADIPNGALFIENNKLMKKGETNEEIECYYSTTSGLENHSNDQ